MEHLQAGHLSLGIYRTHWEMNQDTIQVSKYHKDNQNYCLSWYFHLCDGVRVSELGLYIIFSVITTDYKYVADWWAKSVGKGLGDVRYRRSTQYTTEGKINYCYLLHSYAPYSHSRSTVAGQWPRRKVNYQKIESDSKIEDKRFCVTLVMDGEDSENDGWRRETIDEDDTKGETMDDEKMRGSHEEYESEDL